MKRQYISKITNDKIKQGDLFNRGESYHLVQNEAGEFEGYIWVYNEDIAFYISPGDLEKYFEEVRSEDNE